MLKGLMSKNLVPGQVQMIITTHGHPDHFGQGNFFPNARHFFASYEYTGTSFIRTELYNAETMKLTKNTELWNTPGHTSQDVSLIVRNTKCCGTVAVVGDLFYTKSDAINSEEWDLDAWDQVIGHQNRRRIICTADWIVPGHGKIFKAVLETHDMLSVTSAQDITQFRGIDNEISPVGKQPSLSVKNAHNKVASSSAIVSS
uniref:Lactamase_B domain-containing protein n=1 Tax=Syphacia muris TaxID=451379 RepID=A0A0N5AVJ4_9BILA